MVIRVSTAVSEKVMNATVGKVSGGALSVGTGVAGAVIGSAGLWLQSSIAPQLSTAATVTTSCANSAIFNSGGYNFMARSMSPSDRDIKSIDDFFTAFGYSVQRYEDLSSLMKSVPFSKNKGNGGQSFYIQTRGAIVKSAHALAATQMAQMLDGGIRLWKGKIGVSGGGSPGAKNFSSVSIHDDGHYWKARAEAEEKYTKIQNDEVERIRNEKYKFNEDLGIFEVKK